MLACALYDGVVGQEAWHWATTISQSSKAPVRQLPIYAGEGAAASPTGKTRQLHYELVPGEAGWLLRLDRTTDF